MTNLKCSFIKWNKKATKPGGKTAPHLWKHIKEFFLLAQSVRIVFFFLTLSLLYNRTFVNWAWVTHLQFAIDLGHRVWINSKSIIRQLKQVFVLYSNNNNNGFFTLLFFCLLSVPGHFIREMKINNQLTGRLEQPFTLDQPDCRARLVAPAAWCKWIPTLALNTHTHTNEKSHAQRENSNKINSSYRVKWRHL